MSLPRIRHCRLPHSPKHPGTVTGEDPHHQRPRKCTVENAHKVLFPPCDEAEHDVPIDHPLIGAYHYDTCMHLCPYSPRRRCRGVGRGQPLTDPVREPSLTSIPHSPSWWRVALLPSNSTKRHMFLFFYKKTQTLKIVFKGSMPVNKPRTRHVYWSSHELWSSMSHDNISCPDL